MSDYISQTITVSSCQSDIGNQCRIKTPCITGMAEKSNPPLAAHCRGGGGAVGSSFAPSVHCHAIRGQWAAVSFSTLWHILGPLPWHHWQMGHRGRKCLSVVGGGGGGWHKASVSDCFPLAAPIGLSPLLILTLCGSKRVLVVSTEPPDDLSCLTTPGVGRPRDGLLPVPLSRCIQMHQCWGGWEPVTYN